LPLAGLWTHRRAFDRARPRSNHQPPETPMTCAIGRSYPLLGFARSLPSDTGGYYPARGPFSVFMGLMPCRSTQSPKQAELEWIGSLSEVLHLPWKR
jgi:hypothetical protein